MDPDPRGTASNDIDSKPARISWYTILTDQSIVTREMLAHGYGGRGTLDDPHVVTFLEKDCRDPMQFSARLRWLLCLAGGYVTFSVAFISSAYTGSIRDVAAALDVSAESATLGLSLFLLGFVLGPFLWAPLSELFGRQAVLLSACSMHATFNLAACFSQSLSALLILRLLSGASGAATLTNSGAVIADVFPPRQRGLAMTVYALIPLFAPVLGPILGAYVSSTWGWRASMAGMALLSLSALGVAAVALPETYAPVLLERRARRLAAITGRAYVSSMATAGRRTGEGGLGARLAATLSRPFALAAREPIISLLALYQAVVFGILYLTFTAFPIIYTDVRGWPAEQSGLSFAGVLAGILLSVAFALWDNARYVRLLEALPRGGGGAPPPEVRLLSCGVGGVCIVAGLFWFAATAAPRVPWPVNVAAGVPFGLGVVLVTIGSTNYIVDSYVVYAASALTVCICGRAVCGAVFPLFVRGLFASVGVWWGLSIPALMSLVCLPVPWVFYCYGPQIRARGKYAMRVGPEDVDETTRLLS